MPMPIVLPIPITTNTYQNSGHVKFIETTEGNFFNICMAGDCGIYKSSGQFWIWFRRPGGCSHYYVLPYQTHEEAKKKLMEILEK